MDRLIHILIEVAVAVSLFSTIGILVMEDINEKLHYLAPPATVGIGLITIAVVLQEGLSQASVKTLLCAFIVFVTNPVLTHATSRAARIREFGHWVSQPKERPKRAG